jgi:hypothetical protein
MYNENDPHLPPEQREHLRSPYGPDSTGNDMVRSIVALGVIVVAVLAGLWIAGA